MKRKIRAHQVIGAIVYILGFLLGLAFSAVAVLSDLEGASFWGLQEAAMFPSDNPVDGRLNQLRCPIILTSQETGTISTSVTNPHDVPITQIIQADISDPTDLFHIKQDRQKIVIESNSKKEFSWTITPEDRLYNRLILARVYLYQQIAYGPAKTAHCGVLVWDFLGLSSKQMIIIWVFASLVLMVAGGGLWLGKRIISREWSDKLLNRLALLAGLVLVEMIVNLLGIFIVAVIIYVLILVVLLSMLDMLIYKK